MTDMRKDVFFAAAASLPKADPIIVVAVVVAVEKVLAGHADDRWGDVDFGLLLLLNGPKDAR